MDGPVERFDDIHVNYKYITIPMEEYKELLIIKGKYEELKNQQTFTPGIRWNGDKITYRDSKDVPIEPYKVTCGTVRATQDANDYIRENYSSFFLTEDN